MSRSHVNIGYVNEPVMTNEMILKLPSEHQEFLKCLVPIESGLNICARLEAEFISKIALMNYTSDLISLISFLIL